MANTLVNPVRTGRRATNTKDLRPKYWDKSAHLGWALAVTTLDEAGLAASCNNQSSVRRYNLPIDCTKAASPLVRFT
ncbi:MAG TPA: hypothetical protein VFQ02_01125 [Nitrospira sp.]|nr:hypothetical protein [Nitrospira sp.]